MTESDELRTALDAAAVRWPGLSRAQLLVRLALEGHRVGEAAHRLHRAERLAAIERHGGALTGAFGPGYLDRLRDEWPS
ncbi:hypothetical protein [Geodermatophilus sp. URMC 63]